MARYTSVPSSLQDPEYDEKDVEERVLDDMVDEDLTKYDRLLLRLTCLCAVLSALFALATLLGRSPPSRSNTAVKRPNPYPGLDAISYGDEYEPFKPITSLSQLLLQIQTNDPSRKLHEDASRQRDSVRGTLYPDDRHFIASREMSTVVQFKNLDYGMERCVLHAVLPNKTASLDPAIQLKPSSIIDVWRLDQDTEISPQSPETWALAPRRRALLERFEFPSENGEWRSKEFHCPSLTFTILEFACASVSPDCHVEFWQDRMSANGVYLEQHDSFAKPKPSNSV
ncbi:hypothetical protein CC1G_09585 [Coprinopsis cinerea okayama7|uniref:Ubiquitin 3 binding protein But2 C-terminal domain-containing protein n=1 Tax=Coprinopsis cinerea (strain Okayama-7 / 130 / ATCC MYA-4618 / FGSC 9003) TaxID=240176 RepID=A8P996_COPC7|nr:hypothetical protein CC1G_09585 [Coprinopsis cinerea okayama7\|eukprot:XP_001839730.1 hypothetical protein CC1G_09585 [Coprinopsis cinerea okayama7\